MASWTIRSLLDEMPARGERPAIVAFSDGARQSCSYAELASRAEALATGLRAAGVAPGERVFLVGPNSIDWITVYLGALAAGLVVAPLDNLMQASEIEQVANAVLPRLAFASSDHVDELRRILPAERCYAIGSVAATDAPSWRSLLSSESRAGSSSIEPDADALLLQTSGTTGAAKLFMLQMRQLGANVVPLAASGIAGPSDRLILPLPLHHVYPQVVGLLAALCAGATIVLPASITGAALLSALQAERATGIIAVPRLYEALLAGLEDTIRQRSRVVYRLYKLALSASAAVRRRLGWSIGRVLFGQIRRRMSPELRLFVSGGARLDPAVAWKLAGLGFDVQSGYGLAETAATHTANLTGRDRIGTEGKPFPGGEVRIDGPDEEGVGEILLRGPNLFDGYLDPEKTRGAFTADGWFRTGDLGRLDEEGFLIVTGRVKETIVLGGGKKVNPEDLEKVYSQSPFISELGVLESDGRLVALVRADRAAVADAGLVRAENPIRVSLAEAARTLPSHERLAGFAVVRNPLPRTRLGKLRRFMLPDLYRQAQAGTAREPVSRVAIEDPLLRQPRIAAAWRLLQERYADRLASLDDYLALDLGVDSLEWIGLSLELEQRLGINLEGANLGQLATVRGLLEAVGHAPTGATKKSLPTDVEAWLQTPPPWQSWIARRVAGVNRVLVRTLFRLRVEGLEHLPTRGPYAIASNHLSYLDAFVMAAALPPRILPQTHWGAAEHTLPAVGRLRWLYVALNIFPLEEASPAFGDGVRSPYPGRGRSVGGVS